MKNNRWLPKTCSMTRGIRQGCPIFALLFLFVAEILSIKIKNEPNINLNYVLQFSETNLNALDRNFRFFY